MKLAHPVKDALTKFSLVSGAGDGETTACAMSLLNWIWRNGDEWSDSPECAHPIIRALVINANDDPDTTPEMRAELVKAGEHGILDTWWVPAEVIAWAQTYDREAEQQSVYERALTAIKRLAEWKADPTHPRAYLGDANLRGANLRGANLRGANLRGANLGDAYLGDANLGDANLRDAYLGDAYGTPLSGIPAGWKLNANGLFVKDDA